MITVSSVVQASQGELLCITYEIFLMNIKKAIETNQQERQRYIDKGLEIIKQLAENLDLRLSISQDLFHIYIYVQGLLINSKFNLKKLEEAYTLMEIIYEGYKRIVEKEEVKVPVMKNIENVYVGVTYGKGILNETTLPDTNRGFRA